MMTSYFADNVARMKSSVKRPSGRAIVGSVVQGPQKRMEPGRVRRAVGMAVASLIVSAPLGASAQDGKTLVPYDHPVFHNGHRVLFHGVWRGGAGHAKAAAADDSEPAKSEPAKTAAPASHHEFLILVDTDDSCATRMSADLVAALHSAGVKARALAEKTSPAALGRYVASDAGDIAIAPLDALMADDKNADWHARAPFVARLGAEPIEIIASTSVTAIDQLNGRKVSLGVVDSVSDASGGALFARLGVKPNVVHDGVSASLGELAEGKIDAVLVVGANNFKAVGDFGKGGRFHLVPVAWSPALRGIYAPAKLTAKDRPNLVAGNDEVDTVATPMALIAIDAAPGSPRAAQDGAFVSALFEKFDALLVANYEPSWREVNLAASAEWPRLTAAQDWITSHHGQTDASLEAFRTAAHAAAATKDGPGAGDADSLYQALMQGHGAQP